MACRLVPSEMREDAVAEAMLCLVGRAWPDTDLEGHNDRQVAAYLRLRLAGVLRNYVRDRNAILQVEYQSDESFLEPAGPSTIVDPLAQEIFREMLDALRGKERTMAELLAAGHSFKSATTTMRIDFHTATRLRESIRDQLKFCLA